MLDKDANLLTSYPLKCKSFVLFPTLDSAKYTFLTVNRARHLKMLSQALFFPVVGFTYYSDILYIKGLKAKIINWWVMFSCSPSLPWLLYRHWPEETFWQRPDKPKYKWYGTVTSVQPSACYWWSSLGSLTLKRWSITTSDDWTKDALVFCAATAAKHVCSLIELRHYFRDGRKQIFYTYGLSDAWLGRVCVRCEAVPAALCLTVCRCLSSAGELEGRIRDCSWARFIAAVMLVFIPPPLTLWHPYNLHNKHVGYLCSHIMTH